MRQATIIATITDATPQIIRQLLADTRTSHDTSNVELSAARKNHHNPL